MKFFLRTLLASLALALCTAHAAVDVAGVRFEEHSALAGRDLTLNGAGLRTRFMFKVYAMALYLPQPAATPEAVLAVSGPRRIHIVTVRELGAEQFVDALIDGLRKNHPPAELDALQASIAAFRTAMLSIDQAAAGTEVLLDWVPGAGTRLTVGGTQRGEDIPDEAFYRALLRVWLGPQPVQPDLKKRLLGGTD